MGAVDTGSRKGGWLAYGRALEGQDDLRPVKQEAGHKFCGAL